MWLYLYAPHLYLETWNREEYDIQPIALIDSSSRYVLDINPTAMSAGIKPYMNITTASALSPQCKMVSFNNDAMLSANHQLASKLLDYASWVSLDNKGFYLEIGSMKKLFGNPLSISNNIKQALPNITFFSSSAPNAKTAKLLASSRLEQHLTDKTASLFLKCLSLDRLNFEESTELALKRLGIKTFNQLLSLKFEDIAYRIDDKLALELYQIMGKKDYYPNPFKPKPIFYKQYSLQTEAEHSQQLRFPLKHLISDFCNFLQEHDLSSQHLTIQGIDRHQNIFPFSLNQAVHTQSSKHWLDACRYALENYQPESAIISLTVFSNQFIKKEADSLELFENTNQQFKESNGLLNSLKNKLGENSYYFLNTLHNPLPEGQTLKSKTRSPSNTPLNHKYLLSDEIPWILTTPIRINRQKYVLLQGPHRLQGSWWTQSFEIRDYYTAQHTNGAHHWIYQNPLSQWYLHGYFS